MVPSTLLMTPIQDVSGCHGGLHLDQLTMPVFGSPESEWHPQ